VNRVSALSLLLPPCEKTGFGTVSWAAFSSALVCLSRAFKAGWKQAELARMLPGFWGT
jgi:hypothetical protein